jgi:hypothetical protein
MSKLPEVTQLLVSCWLLANNDRPIPTSHGLLDHALKSAWDNGAFPDWARKALHFVDARVGLQCVELPAILDWAQSAELTTAPNPSYRFTQVRVSQGLARRLVRQLQVPEEAAVAWGKLLSAGIEEAGRETEDINAVEIEAY